MFNVQSTFNIEYIHIYAILNRALYNLYILEQYEYSQSNVYFSISSYFERVLNSYLRLEIRVL